MKSGVKLMMADKGNKGPKTTKKKGYRTYREDKRWSSRILWRAYFMITAVILVFTIGVVGFMYLEPGMTPMEAFHLTMQTITTVGYGDVEIKTDEGRLFSDILMIFGLAIATIGVASLLEYIVSGKLKEAMRSKDYEGMIRRMKDHVIVCGYGRVGRAAVEALIDEKVPFVVLEKDPEALDDLDLNIPRFIGDATHDDDILKSGVKKAIAVIVASGSDADNLMTVVTAKYIKPGIIAIARSTEEEDKEKFLKVGADMMISPETEGGKSMANMLTDAQEHVIVAGYGRVGKAVARELHSMGVSVIVMEKDAEKLEFIPGTLKHMEGDVTREADLIRAGIDKATAVIPTCGADAANLLATVTAKYYKPSITVISRASSPEDVGKMLKVGADVVISPEVEGGKSMARWASQAYRLATD